MGSGLVGLTVLPTTAPLLVFTLSLSIEHSLYLSALLSSHLNQYTETAAAYCSVGLNGD